MKYSFYLFLFLLPSQCFSQELKVLFASNATLENKKYLLENTNISIHNTAIVKQNGHLTLSNSTGWSFNLNAGKYNLDSCYQLYKERYSEYDSAKAIIDVVFPNGLNCKFNSVCSTNFHGDIQELYFKQGNIAFNNSKNDKIKPTSDTITISWKDPKDIGSRYFLVVQNLFEDVIDYKISNQKHILINLRNYIEIHGSYEPLLITVISEDCRMSSKIYVGK